MMRALDRVRGRRSDFLPLADLLPYVMCGRVGDFEPLHLLDDGALGFALQFDVPVADTQLDAEEATSALIDQALRTLPPGVHWQWFVRSCTYVEDRLQRCIEHPGADDLARACTAQFVQRWRAAQREGFFPADSSINFFPRSQSILIALKSPPLRPARASFETVFGRPETADRVRSEFIEAARNLQAALQAQSIATTAVGADALANWVADLIFPLRRFDRTAVSTGLHSAREAIASLGRIDLVEPRGFRSVSGAGAVHHRVVSMLWHPHAVRAGMLNSLAMLRPTLCVCLSGRVLPLAASTLRLKAQNLLNARSAHRFNEVETQARAQAIGDVEQRLFAEGERLVEGRLQVHLIETSADEAEEAARVACNHLRELDIEAAQEEDIGSSLILRGCLPFAVYEQTERKLRRSRRFLSRDFADLHPSGGCWQGMDPPAANGARAASPIVMYSNPLGEPLFVDPSKAERNPHALVVGQSGSGKSFFVHDYLLQLWRLPDVRLFLVSIKPDYRKLALLLGRYVELTLDSAESLNPFAGAPTLENQARWVAALSLMITEGRPGERLSREHEIALQEASLAAAARSWDAGSARAIRETILEDVCLELERRAGTIGRDLALQLFPYRRGPFRRLFNGPCTIGSADRFVFFNLCNILRQPCSAAASFCVFSLIDRVMHDVALRGVPKGLIADEVWALVQDPFAAAILERSLKAYRSLGGFALPIVQDPRDLDTPAGRVILVNTATKVILPMDRTGQDEIGRYVRLNERELELVRNLRLVKRRYSEFFVSIEGIHSAKGLLIPDPLRYAISTTDPADEAELDRLYRESGDMLQAVQRFARETPYGIAAGGRAHWKLLAALAIASVVLALALAWPQRGAQEFPQPTPQPQIAERQGAAEQAARLLSSEPSPNPLPPAAANASNPAFNPASNPVPAARPERPEQSIEELQALARSWIAASHSADTGSAVPAPPKAPTDGSAMRPLRRAREARPPIPERIEDTSNTSGSDPLQAMMAQATVLMLSAQSLPWVLLEVRTSSEPAQARLAGASKDGAWFEPGDSPTPGWMLVRVEPHSATLMSHSGEFVQLPLEHR